MKKLKILTLALLCALITPVFAGCFGGSGPKLEIYVSPAIYYEVGSLINLDNAKLKYGENYIAITENMVSSFSTETAGSKQMIITHDNKTLPVNYYVFENVQHNAWYKASVAGVPGFEAINDGYSYIQFNKMTKTFIMVNTNTDTPEYDEDMLEYITHSYTQTIGANGIKISSTETHPEMNAKVVYEFSNITKNSFTLDCKGYIDNVLMPEYSYTLSFTKM